MTIYYLIKFYFSFFFIQYIKGFVIYKSMLFNFLFKDLLFNT